VTTLDTLLPRLRQLKLSGMGDAIGARAVEARTRQLAPLEFLLLLLDDELARREADGVARRIRAARFEDHCDLRDFDFGYNPETPKAQLWDLASGRFIDEQATVILCGPTGVGESFVCGPTGVGESFVAQALGVAACRQRRTVLFTKTGTLLTDLAGGRADGSHAQRLRRYLDPTLLILDDFAMREYTLPQTEDLYDLISRRYRHGALILTTNRAPNDLYALFPHPVLAEGLLARLLNSAYILTMLGRRYRPQLRPGFSRQEVLVP
jgi:DNA replication protein DnaC